MVNNTGFKPWGVHVLIELPHIEEKTKSGIIKSESMIAQEAVESNEEPQLIVAVGDECKYAKVGMRVKIKNHSVPVMEIHGSRYAVVEEYTIVGEIIPEKKTRKISA